MARGKKKESTLTPEEKLAQALVPVEEQPYKLPKNWCWVKIGTVSDIYTGNSINERVKAERYTGQTQGRIFIATKDIGFDSSINYDTNVRITDYENFKMAPANTALLCIEGGSAGRKIGFTIHDVCFGNKLCAFKTSKIHSKYIFFFLQSQCFLDGFESKKHGLIGGVSVRDIGDISLALPPLAEQHRIVDRIEYLFAKLDEAKEKAQSVLGSFETRKAAILHKAFTGELTAKWRAEQRVSFETWKSFPLAEIATVVSGYAFSSKDFREENTVPCIKITNVGVGEYVADDYEFLPESYLDEYERFAVKKGDILISLTRSFINAGLKVCICEEERASLLNQRVALIKNCNTGYIFYYLRSDDVLRYVKEKSKTTNQPNLSIKDLNSMLIAVPCADEQTEIVRILDSLLAKEQQAKEAAEAVLEKIDLLKKSILARAFRGELGTNDPTEESAVELLKLVIC